MSLFTVEQVELMRRLRLTGITAQQIIDAFDTLERLEADLAPFQNHIPTIDAVNGGPPNAAFIPPPSILGTNHITAIKTFASPYDSLLNRFQKNQNGSPASGLSHIGGSNGHVSRRKRSIPNSQFATLQQPNQEENGLLADTNDGGENEMKNSDSEWRVISAADESRNESLLSEDQSFMQDNRSMPDLELLESADIPVQERPLFSVKLARRRRSEPRPRATGPRQHTAMMDYSHLVDERLLEEFVNRGEAETLREIKEFVAARQLRQQTIAIMTGVSQPYISRFLSGTGRELSTRVRRVMYRWYLALRNNPDLIHSLSANQDMGMGVAANEDAGPPTMVSVSNSSIFPSATAQVQQGQSHFSNSIFSSPNNGMVRHSSQSSSPGKESLKRERFIFKPVHVRLLHKYFALDPYPNIRKREEIAAACNRAYETMDGDKFVPPRERVSSQVVGNWFSNRRKEKKRRGEMKLRRIRGGPRFGAIRRADYKAPSMPVLTCYQNNEPAGLSLSNLLTEPKSEATHIGESLQKRDRSDLANIVNELHAMGSTSFSFANPYGGGETSAISVVSE